MLDKPISFAVVDAFIKTITKEKAGVKLRLFGNIFFFKIKDAVHRHQCPVDYFGQNSR